MFVLDLLLNHSAGAAGAAYNLAIGNLPLVVMLDPAGQTVLTGQTATLTAAASGTPAPPCGDSGTSDGTVLRGYRTMLNGQDHIHSDKLMLDAARAAPGSAATFDLGLDLYWLFW